MPNRVALLRAEIEAAYPGATLRHRGEAGFSMTRPDGSTEHRYTTGPWHWRESVQHDWTEIDTDLEERADSTWKHGVKSAKFDTVLTDDGRRRFYPRRWIQDEYVEFGALEYERPLTGWQVVPTGIMSRVANRFVGSDLTDSRYEIGFSGKGSRTELVLKRSTQARSLRWSVTLVGLTWQDGVLVSASDSESVGFIRPPTWTDATDREPTVIPWEHSGGYMTLTPDFTGAVYPVTVDPDYAIADGADDGDYKNEIRTTNTYIEVGNSYFMWDTTLYAWLRFAGIAAAKNQDCTAATIALRAYGNASSTTVNTDFFGIDEDDHAAPTSNAEWTTDHGLHTSAVVAWDSIGSWTAGTQYTSPDLSSIFDELFSRDGWASGNDVGIHWDDGGSSTGKTATRNAASYEHTTYTEPVLSLTLAAGGEAKHLVRGSSVYTL